MVKVMEEDIIVKEPKIATGDRYVSLFLKMVSLLKEYLSFCQGELELHEGRELTTEDYIFHRHGANLPMTLSTFTWRFKSILKKHVPFQDRNVHSLRPPYVKHTTKKYRPKINLGRYFSAFIQDLPNYLGTTNHSLQCYLNYIHRI